MPLGWFEVVFSFAVETNRALSNFNSASSKYELVSHPHPFVCAR